MTIEHAHRVARRRRAVEPLRRYRRALEMACARPTGPAWASLQIGRGAGLSRHE